MVGLGYENFIEERKFPEPSSTLKILSTLTSSTKVALYCRGRVGKILGKKFFQLVSTIGSFHENFFAFEIYSYK